MKRIHLLTAVLGLSLLTASAKEPTILKKVPELAYTVPGKGQQLLSQYRGKVVALEIIETTCPHCQASSHALTKLQNDLGGQGFQALDVAMNPDADRLVGPFSEEQQVSFPVGWVTLDQAQSFLGLGPADRFSVPQVFLIDTKGYIHWRTPPTGEDDLRKDDVLRQRIEEMLKSKPAAAKKPVRKR